MVHYSLGSKLAYQHMFKLASIPGRRGKRRPGIHCMRMRLNYPKKGVIRLFADTVSKIYMYTSCIL